MAEAEQRKQEKFQFWKDLEIDIMLPVESEQIS